MKKPFPWWIVAVGFLLLRWGILIGRHPERAPGLIVGLVGLLVLALAALQGMKMWMQGKLQKMEKARYVSIDMAQMANGGAPSTPVAPIPTVDGTLRSAPKIAPGAALDFAAIDTWSQQWHALGFSWLLDYSLDEETRKIAPGQFVCRLMVHPTEAIYACVRQTVMNSTALPVRPTLYTFLEDGGEIISAATNANDSHLALHRPNDVYDFQPGATAAEILEVHRKRRAQIQNSLGRSLNRRTDAEFYLDYERRNAPRLAQAYRKLNVLRTAKNLATASSLRELHGDLKPHVAS